MHFIYFLLCVTLFIFVVIMVPLSLHNKGQDILYVNFQRIQFPLNESIHCVFSSYCIAIACLK